MVQTDAMRALLALYREGRISEDELLARMGSGEPGLRASSSSSETELADLA